MLSALISDGVILMGNILLHYNFVLKCNSRGIFCSICACNFAIERISGTVFVWYVISVTN